MGNPNQQGQQQQGRDQQFQNDRDQSSKQGKTGALDRDEQNRDKKQSGSDDR